MPFSLKYTYMSPLIGSERHNTVSITRCTTGFRAAYRCRPLNADCSILIRDPMSIKPVPGTCSAGIGVFTARKGMSGTRAPRFLEWVSYPHFFSLRYFAANLVTNSVLVRCEIKQTKCTKFQNRWGSASADHIRIAYCAPETQRLVGVATQSRKQKVGLRHPHFVAHSDASAQRCQCCGIQNKFARKAL